MITPEEIVEVLSECPKENGISEIEIGAVGDIVSRLENRIDPEQPYHLTVRLLEEAQTLCIYVFPLLNIRKDSDIYRKLILLNLGLGCGCLCSNPSDGRLLFKIEHFCEDEEGPSQEFFVRLCFECLRDVRVIEQFLLFENMVDSGLTQESAEQLVKTLFRVTSDFRFVDWDRTIMQDPFCKKIVKE
ncbi:MAG: hypothetical protein KAV87_13910 [Desulfobacteraceae bacterium]|nr:hypothetical protein [Desulfobacteraceae bacterium]